jgi:hypothetical protein
MQTLAWCITIIYLLRIRGLILRFHSWNAASNSSSTLYSTFQQRGIIRRVRALQDIFCQGPAPCMLAECLGHALSVHSGCVFAQHELDRLISWLSGSCIHTNKKQAESFVPRFQLANTPLLSSLSLKYLPFISSGYLWPF